MDTSKPHVNGVLHINNFRLNDPYFQEEASAPEKKKKVSEKALTLSYCQAYDHHAKKQEISNKYLFL